MREEPTESIRIYLDDDVDSDIYISFLEQLGFEVISPRSVGMSGKPDHEHLAFATNNNVPILTRNRNDFIRLHALTPDHAGIFIVHRYNHLKKDMDITEIANAIKNIKKLYVEFEGQIFYLVHYKY